MKLIKFHLVLIYEIGNIRHVYGRIIRDNIILMAYDPEILKQNDALQHHMYLDWWHILSQ